MRKHKQQSSSSSSSRIITSSFNPDCSRINQSTTEVHLDTCPNRPFPSTHPFFTANKRNTTHQSIPCKALGCIPPHPSSRAPSQLQVPWTQLHSKCYLQHRIPTLPCMAYQALLLLLLALRRKVQGSPIKAIKGLIQACSCTPTHTLMGCPD